MIVHPYNPHHHAKGATQEGSAQAFGLRKVEGHASRCVLRRLQVTQNANPVVAVALSQEVF